MVLRTESPTSHIDRSLASALSSGYDDVQLWFFGYSEDYSLTEGELSAIENHLASGGGIFATGDHGSLGESLCSRLPRARDMRRWVFDGTSTSNSEQVGGSAIATLTPPLFARVPNSETDSLIKSVYATKTGMNRHALMNYENGEVIKWLPDHRHEGDCQPWNNAEPTAETVAWAMAWRTEQVNDGLGNTYTDVKHPRCVPLIRCLDLRTGDPSNDPGRVVVDSTFHHFLNWNVDPLFTDTVLEEQKKHWQAYVRNIFHYLVNYEASTKIKKLAKTSIRNHISVAEILPRKSDLIPGQSNNRQSIVNAIERLLANHRFFSAVFSDICCKRGTARVAESLATEILNGDES